MEARNKLELTDWILFLIVNLIKCLQTVSWPFLNDSGIDIKVIEIILWSLSNFLIDKQKYMIYVYSYVIFWDYVHDYVYMPKGILYILMLQFWGYSQFLLSTWLAGLLNCRVLHNRIQKL